MERKTAAPAPPPAPHLADGAQLLMDLEEVRERHRRLTDAMSETDKARGNVVTLERQLRAARRVLKEAELKVKVVLSGERRRQQAEG